MIELLDAAQKRGAAEEEVKAATARLLAVERRGLGFQTTHEALRDLVSALIASADATRTFAIALAIDEDALAAGATVDDLVPPIIEHQ